MDRFDLATHARFSFISLLLKHVFVVFHKKKKKKKLGKRCRFLFFLLNSFAEIVCIFA